MKPNAATLRPHEHTTPDGRVADGARITIRLDPKRMDLQNLAVPCPLPSDREPVHWRVARPLQPIPGQLRAIMREYGVQRRFHEHTRRLLDSVTGQPEAVGHRPESEQTADSIDLAICAVVYKRMRINGEFREYRIMNRSVIFRICHSQ